jgi:hypothetical protein
MKAKTTMANCRQEPGLRLPAVDSEGEEDSQQQSELQDGLPESLSLGIGRNQAQGKKQIDGVQGIGKGHLISALFDQVAVHAQLYPAGHFVGVGVQAINEEGPSACPTRVKVVGPREL